MRIGSAGITSGLPVIHPESETSQSGSRALWPGNRSYPQLVGLVQIARRLKPDSDIYFPAPSGLPEEC